ncbi:MAG: hypothetical protein LIO76_09500 [Clostridiales bacterium]|nr:hypothetical protein [Clostridiales bacterium]
MNYMDFEPMDREEMMEYLREIEVLEKKIPEMLEEAYNGIEPEEACIYRKALQEKDTDGMSGYTKGMKMDNVYYTLLSVHRELDQQMKERAQELLQITKAQEKLDYVKRCIKKLPSDQEEVIVCLFVKKTKWEAYSKQSGLCRAVVFRRRTKALENLVMIYNSRFTGKAGKTGTDSTN